MPADYQGHWGIDAELTEHIMYLDKPLCKTENKITIPDIVRRDSFALKTTYLKGTQSKNLCKKCQNALRDL